MPKERLYLGARWLAVVAILVVAQEASLAQEAGRVVIEKPIVAERTKAESVSSNRVIVGFEPKSSPWIGVVCVPVDAAVRAHANLPEGQGVMVGQVVAGGPAEKAGLKQYDILLKAGPKPLTKPDDLVKALELMDWKTIILQVVRSGKEQKVTVAPEKRPKTGELAVVLREGDPTSVKVLQEWVTNIQKDGTTHRTLRLRTVGPEFVSRLVKFPDDLKISITKQGNKPVAIVASRGDKSWAVTESKVGELPNEVRPFVVQLLGRHTVLQGSDGKRVAVSLPVTTTGTVRRVYNWVATVPPTRTPKGTGAGDVGKRLDDIEHKLQEVLKELRAVRQLHKAAARAEGRHKKP